MKWCPIIKPPCTESHLPLRVPGPRLAAHNGAELSVRGGGYQKQGRRVNPSTVSNRYVCTRFIMSHGM